MPTFVRAFLHLAYSVSLLAVLLFVTLNVSLPVSLQWPAYCGQSCRPSKPMYDQCVNFCQFHTSASDKIRDNAEVTVQHIKNLFEKENGFFAKLVEERPTWFIILSGLFNVSIFMSVLFWLSTILSDTCARSFSASTQTASMVIFCIFAAHAYFIFVDPAFDLDDVFDKFDLYTRREHIILALMYAFPVLQILVLRSIPSVPQWMYEW